MGRVWAGKSRGLKCSAIYPCAIEAVSKADVPDNPHKRDPRSSEKESGKPHHVVNSAVFLSFFCPSLALRRFIGVQISPQVCPPVAYIPGPLRQASSNSPLWYAIFIPCHIISAGAADDFRDGGVGMHVCQHLLREGADRTDSL